MINKFTFALILAGPAANAAAGHGAEGIPWGTIGVQAFNLAVLLGVLVYLLRKTVSAHFANRSQSYRDLVERAERAQQEAARNHAEVSARLAKLEASAAQTLQRAQNEATEMRQRLLADAKMLSAKLDQEAQRTALLEVDKAKAELRRDLLHASLKSSAETMRGGLGSPEQRKLQNEFAEKIEVLDQ